MQYSQDILYLSDELITSYCLLFPYFTTLTTLTLPTQIYSQIYPRNFTDTTLPHTTLPTQLYPHNFTPHNFTHTTSPTQRYPLKVHEIQHFSLQKENSGDMLQIMQFCHWSYYEKVFC